MFVCIAIYVTFADGSKVKSRIGAVRRQGRTMDSQSDMLQFSLSGSAIFTAARAGGDRQRSMGRELRSS